MQDRLAYGPGKNKISVIWGIIARLGSDHENSFIVKCEIMF